MNEFKSNLNENDQNQLNQENNTKPVDTQDPESLSTEKTPSSEVNTTNSSEHQNQEAHYKMESEKYLDQLIRLQAEFSNYRKRSEKEKSDALRLGRELMLEKIISLIDVMEQALKHSENATDTKSVILGFQMVISEFNRFLKSEGAEPIQAKGNLFDPHQHEAIEHINVDHTVEENTILEEMQKGYIINGKLFRPAKVKVAKRSKTDEANQVNKE